MASTQPIVFEYVAKDNASRVMEAVKKAADKQIGSTERLIAKLKEEEVLRKQGAKALDLYRAKLDGATAEQQQQIAALHQSIAASKNYSQANGALMQQSRYMRGMFGQMGHQIQDVAVQLQMGTNGMIVFAQQGGQIASLLGPWGAIAGAVISVAGAVYTYIKAADNAVAITKKLSDELTAAGNAMKPVLAAKLTLEQEKLAAKMELTTAKIAKQEKIISSNNYVSDKHKETLKELREELATQADQYAANADALYRFGLGTDTSTSKLDKLQDGLTQQYQLMGKNAREVALYEAAEEKAGLARINAINQTFDLIDAKNAEMAATYAQTQAVRNLVDARTTEEEQLWDSLDALEKSLRSKEQVITDAYTNQERIIKKAADDNVISSDYARELQLKLEKKYQDDLIALKLKGIDKTTKAFGLQRTAMIESQKVMQSMANGMADAIVKAESMKDAFKSMARSIVQDMLTMYLRAQMMNLLGMFASIGVANRYGTNVGSQQTNMLAAQDAGLIAPWESFNGGGFTGLGSRSGGIDGRGGFPAILHPNETVVDHTKGQSMGDNIVINLNVSTGVAQTVRAEMMNLMPAITNATKAAVADARMRGGSFSKQMVGA